MKFPKAVKLIGKARFNDVFLKELERQKGELPLESICDGGFPEEASIDIELGKGTRTPTGCRVRVNVSFEEAVATGCSDIAFSRGGGELALDIILDRSFEEAETEIDHKASTTPGSRDYDC